MHIVTYIALKSVKSDYPSISLQNQNKIIVEYKSLTQSMFIDIILR